jgi:hypothetical protein
MHGLTRRELECPLPDHGHQGTDTRPGNRRHKGPGPYRQCQSLLQLPTQPRVARVNSWMFWAAAA